jgi:hypothetical protein
MSAEKIQNEQSSRVGVYVAACAMALLGVMLGIFYMMSFPLQAFGSMAERARALEERERLNPIPGDAFYIEGPTLRTRSWEAKRNRILEGEAGTLEISVGEINAWFATRFRGGTPPKADEAEGFVITPSTPNVAVTEDGVLFLSLPAQFTGYSIDAEHVVSAKGAFQSGAPAKFKITNLHIGGAAMPLPGVIGTQVKGALLKAYAQSDEFSALAEAWNRVDSVEISNGGLKLTLL